MARRFEHLLVESAPDCHGPVGTAAAVIDSGVLGLAAVMSVLAVVMLAPVAYAEFAPVQCNIAVGLSWRLAVETASWFEVVVFARRYLPFERNLDLSSRCVGVVKEKEDFGCDVLSAVRSPHPMARALGVGAAKEQEQKASMLFLTLH